MDSQLKTLTERYCPVIRQNVAVEVTKLEQKDTYCCLNTQNCQTERGGCSNRIFGADK